jgi:hypothetical protein
VQQEEAAAADEATHLYNECVNTENCTAKELQDCMQQALQAKVKFLRTDFDKLASVANLKHGPQFQEVVRAFHSIIL